MQYEADQQRKLARCSPGDAGPESHFRGHRVGCLCRMSFGLWDAQCTHVVELGEPRGPEFRGFRRPVCSAGRHDIFEVWQLEHGFCRLHRTLRQVSSAIATRHPVDVTSRIQRLTLRIRQFSHYIHKVSILLSVSLTSHDILPWVMESLRAT